MRDYDERLYAPPGWWLATAACVVVLGAELWAGFGLLAAVATYVVLAVACGAVLWHWGSGRVRVTGGELHAGPARLPLRQAGEVVTLDERQTRAIRGPNADPSAYLFIRPYLKCSVYVGVEGSGPDGGGPGNGTGGGKGEPAGRSAPYWLIGTRRPAELAAAIERSRGAQEPA